jgi:uncharacterized membrane protein
LIYILATMTARQLFAWVLAYFNFQQPGSAGNLFGEDAVNIVTFFYSLLITMVPLFLMSYQADKHQERAKPGQKLEISKMLGEESTGV